VKDLLAETVTGVLGEVPWLPRTYNLETQLAAFITDYHGRQERSEDNLWIVKPWYASGSHLLVLTGHMILV
jgi:tubulin--tyrosine ligase-like protein 12